MHARDEGSGEELVKLRLDGQHNAARCQLVLEICSPRFRLDVSKVSDNNGQGMIVDCTTGTKISTTGD
jgi:hypothetical protein